MVDKCLKRVLFSKRLSSKCDFLRCQGDIAAQNLELCVVLFVQLIDQLRRDVRIRGMQTKTNKLRLIPFFEKFRYATIVLIDNAP